MYLHKEYHTIEIGGKPQEIKMAISFNRETTNWATYEPKKVGYQVTAIPVQRTSGSNFSMEESSVLSGFNDNLLEIDRQSKNRLKSAIAILQERKEKYLDYFKKGNK